MESKNFRVICPVAADEVIEAKIIPIGVRRGTKGFKVCVQCINWWQIELRSLKKEVVSAFEVVAWKRIFKNVYTLKQLLNQCINVFLDSFNTFLCQMGFAAM